MGQLQFTQEGYIEIKGKIREKLNETVNNFIIIGYYMKQVRDNGLYRQDGYRNMAEFAMQEYNLSESTANRFMDINTMFSADGNSPEIKEEYRNYGYSKLQEMLTMKEEDFALVTEDSTVKQIREIKALERQEDSVMEAQEQNELPLLRMAAGETAAADEGAVQQEADAAEKNAGQQETDTDSVATSQEPQRTPLEAVTIAFWKEQKPELLKKLGAGILTPQLLAEEICPSGSRTFSGELCMLVFYGFAAGIKHRYIKDRRPAIDELSYQDFLELSGRLYAEGCMDVEAAAEESYEPLPGQMKVEDIPELVSEKAGGAPDETAGSAAIQNTSDEEGNDAVPDSDNSEPDVKQMREILFRGKRIDNDKWIDGCLLIDYVSGQYFIHANGNSVNESDKVNEDGCLQFVAYEVEHETVCQYTGLIDKNGKQIFEEDIIQYNKKLFKIVWVPDCAHFAAHPLKECSWNPCINIGTVKNAEVIGNIFDNPDLLEEAGNE